MSLISKLIYRLNIIPIKIAANFFCRYQQANSKIYVGRQRSYNNQNNFEKEQNRRTHATWFQDLHKATVSKSVCHWQKEGHRDQWTKWSAQTVHLHNTYIQLVFDKGSNAILWRKDSRATNGMGTIQHPYAKTESPHGSRTFYKNQLRMYHTPKCQTWNWNF